MSQTMSCLSQLKHIKIESSMHYFTSSNDQKSIKSIPIIHHKVQNSSFINKRLRMRGYKSFSKLGALGEQTIQTLNIIDKSVPLKFIKDFEFDPYLCETSGLQELRRSFKKLKFTKKLNLVIRRVNSQNETNIIAPFIQRIRRVKKLRMEFPKTDNIDEVGIKILCQRIVKCQSLKSWDFRLDYMPCLGQPGYRAYLNNLKKLPNLEEVNQDIFTSYTTKKQYRNIITKFCKLPKLKKLSSNMASKNGWTCMTSEDEDEFLPTYIESIADAINPIVFNYKFTKYCVSTDATVAFSELLPKLTNLRSVSLEFLKCKLGELELMVFAEGFRNCHQIEKLTFKVMQLNDLFVENLCQFVHCISAIENLKQFDIYFRRKSFSPAEIAETTRELHPLKNIKFEVTTQSLYVYKI